MFGNNVATRILNATSRANARATSVLGLRGCEIAHLQVVNSVGDIRKLPILVVRVDERLNTIGQLLQVLHKIIGGVGGCCAGDDASNSTSSKHHFKKISPNG